MPLKDLRRGQHLRIVCIFIAVVGLLENVRMFGVGNAQCASKQPSSDNWEIDCFVCFYVIAAGNVVGFVASILLLIGAIMNNASGAALVFAHLLAELIRLALYVAYVICSFLMSTVYDEVDKMMTGNPMAYILGIVQPLVMVFISIGFWIWSLIFLIQLLKNKSKPKRQCLEKQ